MITPTRCSSCGVPLDPSGPGGLCPACLLKPGLEAEWGPATDVEALITGVGAKPGAPNTKK